MALAEGWFGGLCPNCQKEWDPTRCPFCNARVRFLHYVDLGLEAPPLLAGVPVDELVPGWLAAWVEIESSLGHETGGLGGRGALLQSEVEALSPQLGPPDGARMRFARSVLRIVETARLEAAAQAAEREEEKREERRAGSHRAA